MQTKTNHLTQSFIWVSAFLLSNFRGTWVWDVLKQGFGITALPWIEVFIWIILFVLVVRALLAEHLLASYLKLWQQNWLVVLFIAIAFLSLFWSVAVSASLYRSAALLFTSLIGAYLGTRYSLKGLLDLLFRFGAILLIVCFGLALFYPAIGAMVWEPYNGAWRGVFWHKNQFGSLMALFTLVFALGALDQIGKKNSRFALYFSFYLLSVVTIFFSKSVAGYLLCMIVSFSALLAFAWLKIRHRLKPVHYYGMLGLGIVLAAVVFLNLHFIFGLFNRDTSLTGRIPMWNYLLHEVIAKSPWVGYGFGALWSLGSFRVTVQQAVGWGFPVAIADNGFLDILLHVGLLGLIPFLGVVVVMFARSIKFLTRQLSILNFFPLVLMIFAVAANISFSLFLETESFVWLVMVASLFVATREPEPLTAS